MVSNHLCNVNDALQILCTIFSKVAIKKDRAQFLALCLVKAISKSLGGGHAGQAGHLGGVILLLLLDALAGLEAGESLNGDGAA